MAEVLEAEWQSALAVITEWLAQTQRDPSSHRVINCCEDEDQVREWEVLSGSASVTLSLLRTDSDVMLQVFSSVFGAPDGEQATLLAELLRLNASTLSGCAFGIEEDAVVLLADRSMRHMHAAQLTALVNSVLAAHAIGTALAPAGAQ